MDVESGSRQPSVALVRSRGPAVAQRHIPHVGPASVGGATAAGARAAGRSLPIELAPLQSPAAASSYRGSRAGLVSGGDTLHGCAFLLWAGAQHGPVPARVPAGRLRILVRMFSQLLRLAADDEWRGLGPGRFLLPDSRA